LPNCWRPIFLVLPKLNGCQVDLPNYWSYSYILIKHSITNQNFEIHIFASLTLRRKFQDVTELPLTRISSSRLRVDSRFLKRWGNKRNELLQHQKELEPMRPNLKLTDHGGRSVSSLSFLQVGKPSTTRRLLRIRLRRSFFWVSALVCIAAVFLLGH
jgi:hypothetical protein